jgi:hypothetical protein
LTLFALDDFAPMVQTASKAAGQFGLAVWFHTMVRHRNSSSATAMERGEGVVNNERLYYHRCD